METPEAGMQNRKERVSVQQIVDGVVHMIHQGVFRPGKPIREVELCKQFNVSRTPVREALRLLQNNGVVKYIPRCGVQVVELSEQDLIYLTDTRTVLEVLSTREAALRITPEQVEELRGINRDFLEQKETTTNLDNQFHLTIARISGNPCVVEYIQNLLMRQALFASTIPMQPQRLAHSYEEHEAIIRGLELHDPELAAKQADIHFYMSQKSLRSKLQKYLETK
ncbi:MAG TPA: GntR family transcriptional regulator [Candidatus Gemmiger faecigallinarum]|nr:GntR family transcriptional regulator [Candidatus Gemmiger faecigallinarum]